MGISHSTRRQGTSDDKARRLGGVSELRPQRESSLLAALAGWPSVVCVLWSGAISAQTYKLTDLGTLGGTSATVYAVNSAGQAVGSSTLAGNTATHAFLYSNGVMTDLGTLGGTTSEAFGINDAGDVVGYSITANGDAHAALWAQGGVSDLGTAGTSSSYAYGLNSLGQIVGAVGGARNPPTSYVFCDNGTAVSWSAGVATLLPSLNPGAASTAYAINDGGEIAGCSESLVTDSFYGVTWSNGAITQLGFFAGNSASAFSVNATGVVVGQTSNGAFDQATLWIGTTPQALMSTPPSYAYGITDSGAIVGTDNPNDVAGGSRATAWSSASGTKVDLNTVLNSDDSAANTLNYAVASNAAGIIAVNGVVNASGDTHAYLLTPNPPITVTLAAAPTTIVAGQTTTLTWSSTNAIGCLASGGAIGDGWTGTQRATSGNATITEKGVSDAAVTLTFTLSCKSSTTDQSSSATAKVLLNPSPPSNNGGGSFDWCSLIVLSLLATIGRRAAAREFRPGRWEAPSPVW